MKALKLLGIGIAVFVALLAAFVLTIVLRQRSEPSTGVVVPSLPAIPAQAAKPLVPPPVMAAASLAAFRGGQLDECVDAYLEAPPGAAAAEVDEVLAPFRKAKASDGIKRVALQRRCVEQMQGREALATCDMHDPPEHRPAWKMHMMAYYYSVATAVDNDSYMRECLEMHGDWKVTDEANLETFKQRTEHTRKLLDQITPP